MYIVSIIAVALQILAIIFLIYLLIRVVRMPIRIFSPNLLDYDSLYDPEVEEHIKLIRKFSSAASVLLSYGYSEKEIDDIIKHESSDANILNKKQNISQDEFHAIKSLLEIHVSDLIR